MALLDKKVTVVKTPRDEENRGRNVGLGFDGNKLMSKLAEKKKEEKVEAKPERVAQQQGKFDLFKKASGDIKTEIMNKRL